MREGGREGRRTDGHSVHVAYFMLKNAYKGSNENYGKNLQVGYSLTRAAHSQIEMSKTRGTEASSLHC
jgi:hypothetical protein